MAIQLYAKQTGPATIGSVPAGAFQSPVDTVNTGDQLAIKSALQSGEQVGETMLKEEETLQATDLVNAQNDYSMATLEYESKYKLEHEGQDARNTVEDYQAWHKEKAAEFGKRLADNPRMNAMWAKSSSQVAFGSTSRGNQHAFTQEQVYKKSESEKMTSLYLTQAAMNYNKPNVLDAATATWKTKMQALYPDRDLTAIFSDTEKKMATTVVQAGIHDRDIELVELMLYGDPDLKDKDGKRTDHGYQEILADAFPTVQGRVKALRVDVDAIKITDEINARDDLVSKQDKYDVLDKMAVGTKYEEDTIKAGRQYIHANHSYEKELLATRKKEITETYMGRINRAATSDDFAVIINDLIRTPMDEGLRATLLGRARRGAPYAFKNDPTAVAKYREGDNVGLSGDETYNKYKGSFTKPYMDSILAVKNEKGSNRVGKYQDEFNNTLKNAYKKSSAAVRDTNTLVLGNKLDDFIIDYQIENQKLPTNAELDEHVKKLLTEQVYDYGYFDFQDRSIEAGLFKTLEAEDITVDPEDYPDIPIGYRNKIEADYLKQYGKEATQTEVANFYKMMLIDRTR